MESNGNTNTMIPDATTQFPDIDKTVIDTSDRLDISSLGEIAADIGIDANSEEEYGEMSDDTPNEFDDFGDLGDFYYDPEFIFGFNVEVDDVNAENCQTIYEKTSRYLQTEGANVDKAIQLLRATASHGCADAYIALGKLYSEVGSPLHNKALAYECFYKATTLNQGYYYLGLCYINGIGCKKDPQKAVDIFLSGAENSDTDCLCALGICREFGIGCETDYEMAVALYTKASEDGHATAINNLGGCYFYGHGVPQDKEYATELYMKAAELGNSNAECRLGICCEEGDGCEKDPVAAFEHYERASKSFNAIALYRMALCYDKGIGAEQSFAHAFEHYEMSAKRGCAEAMYETGMMFKYGKGTHRNFDEAYKWFSIAAERGISDAEYEVGNCYFEGSGAVRNYEFAFLRYSNAFELDSQNARAALKIGICYLRGLGIDKNEKKAFEWFKRGAELNSRTAMYMLGECYYYGIGTDQSFTSSAECFATAISYEHNYTEKAVPCILALAYSLEHGLGCEKDHTRALSLYKKASDYDDAEAMYLTGMAILNGVGMKAEYAAARVFILRSARKGHVPAMLTMGIFAEEGKGVQKSLDDAKRWYAKAISTDIESTPGNYDFPYRFTEREKISIDAKIEAQYRLGTLLTKNNPTLQDYISSFEYIAHAAAMGHGDAQTVIAKIYVHGGDLKSYYDSPFSEEDATFENGETVPDKVTLGAAVNKLGDAYYDGKMLLKKNKINAAACYKIASELGNVDACYSYGWCLRHGVGVHENDAEAVKWLKLAADKGNVNAAFSYALCCEKGSGTGIKNKSEARSYYRKAASAGHVEAAKRFVLLSKQDE